MDSRDETFQKRLMETFKVEADEHLQLLVSGLLDLEKSTDQVAQSTIIETVFREAHSLKGAARAVNMLEIEAVCQSVESVFSRLKHRELNLTPALFDVLHHALDAIKTLLVSSQDESTIVISEIVAGLDSLETETAIAHSNDLPNSKPAAPALAEVSEAAPTNPAISTPLVPAGATEKTIASDTIRISVAKLDHLLLQAEEMLSIKLTTGQRVSDLQDISRLLEVWQREWQKMEPKVQKARRDLGERVKPDLGTAKMFEFLSWNQSHLETLTQSIKILTQSMKQEQRSMGGMVDDLLEDVKTSFMLPFSTLLDTFPKMLRDLARAQNKEIDLVMQGENVEIDRRILEEIKVPLMHILRNCVAHGIEIPSEREANNKPRRGQITVAVSQPDAGNVQIIISDDGKGVDLERLKEVVINSGLVSRSCVDGFNQQELLALIYRSSVSTSPIITDISGRGLGLTIAQEKVMQLGGNILVSTAHKIGTSFQMILPITIATFRGVLLEAGGRQFVIPTAAVNRVLRARSTDLKIVQDKEVIQLNGQAVQLVALKDILELPDSDRETKVDGAGHFQVVVLGSTEMQFAFMVDQVLDEQEVLVKSLGKKLSRVRNVTGATVLGSGKVVPILNSADLLKSAAAFKKTGTQAIVNTHRLSKAKQSILIAEDSITSRMLLKNVLEGVGYRVKTTVDGVDALTTLKTEQFDLLISDVEMPRMNGFELTEKIRAEKKLSAVPVILLTSRDSQQDRERGIDAGADAYITKSSFDQVKLLNIIRRLI